MKHPIRIMAAIVISISAFASFAGEREDIISHCRSQMGEYGTAMVKACVDQDIEALNTLVSYPDKAKPFISRCRRDMAEYGWAMVKACTDQDIEAEKSLGGY